MDRFITSTDDIPTSETRTILFTDLADYTDLDALVVGKRGGAVVE